MADGGQRPTRRFSAFISYSSEDAAFARRLHRRLETYRLPRRLDRADTGAARQRLKPLFRDVDELTASHDLSASVREALAQSDFLIVLCSPGAARSEWVGREIEYFRALHGDGAILAALIEGAPATAFPPALRRTAAGKEVEPLAADFRRESGFRRLAMLKLVAALAGVELDQLVQRDAQRGTFRAALAAAAAVAVVAVVLGLGWLTLDARAQAVRRAELFSGLVDYYRSDVRQSLLRRGALEEVAALDAAVMRFLNSQDFGQLSADDLRQRALILQDMGSLSEQLGKLDQARTQVDQAHKSTASLLAKEPSDPDRIFAHSQSEYWVGFIHLRSGDGEAARRHFRAYETLARRLTGIDPKRLDWQMEVAYAENNLGTVALRLYGDAPTAREHFGRSLAVKRSIAGAKPDYNDIERDIANSHAWYADTFVVEGDLPAALQHRGAQRAILDRLAAKAPEDRLVQNDLLGHELAMARIDAEAGRYASAIQRLDDGRSRALALIAADPKRNSVRRHARAFQLFKARFTLDASSARPRSIAELADCSDAANEGDKELTAFCELLDRRARGDRRPVSLAKFGTISRGVYTLRWGINLSEEARRQ